MRRGTSAAYQTATSHAPRFGSFAAIGLVTFLVSNGGLILLHEIVRLPVYVSAVIAAQVAVAVSFSLNSLYTWRGRGGRPLLQRMFLFESVALSGLLVYLSGMGVVHTALGFHYLLGSVAGAGCSALWNYTVMHRFVFIEGLAPVDPMSRPAA